MDKTLEAVNVAVASRLNAWGFAQDSSIYKHLLGTTEQELSLAFDLDMLRPIFVERQDFADARVGMSFTAIAKLQELADAKVDISFIAKEGEAARIAKAYASKDQYPSMIPQIEALRDALVRIGAQTALEILRPKIVSDAAVASQLETWGFARDSSIYKLLIRDAEQELFLAFDLDEISPGFAKLQELADERVDISFIAKEGEAARIADAYSNKNLYSSVTTQVKELRHALARTGAEAALKILKPKIVSEARVLP